MAGKIGELNEEEIAQIIAGVYFFFFFSSSGTRRRTREEKSLPTMAAAML